MLTTLHLPDLTPQQEEDAENGARLHEEPDEQVQGQMKTLSAYSEPGPFPRSSMRPCELTHTCRSDRELRFVVYLGRLAEN